MNDKNKNPNLIKNGGDGTAVGKMLRWMGANGKAIAPTILELAGTVTGIEGLKDLGNAIKGSDSLSELDKEMLIKEIDIDIEREKAITKRWEADSKSGFWLPNNVRPLTLVFMSLCLLLFILLDSFVNGFDMKESWIDLMSSLLMTIFGGYFVVRSGEKIATSIKGK